MEIRPEKTLTLRDMVAIWRRRRVVVFGVVAGLVILTILYCIVCTRLYEADGTIQVQKESSDAMGLDTLMSAAGDASSGLDADIDLKTQASILQSDTLALQTIEALHLDKTKGFQPRWQWLDRVYTWLTPGKALPESPTASLENSPRRREHVLKVFSNRLTVKVENGTRLIDINYLDPDPRLAAAVVNTLMQSLQDYTFQTRYNATNQASAWLNGQLGDLRKETEDLQTQVEELQRDSNVYSFGTTDAQGREEAYSGVIDRLQQTTLALETAQQNRILKAAIAQAAKAGDAETLSGLAGNLVGGSAAAANNSLAVIQNLRELEATQEAALQDAKAKYGSAYPKLAELRAQIVATNRSIRQEVGRVKERADSDYAIAVRQEEDTRARYEAAKREADALNDKAIKYVIVRQEADDSRQLYEDLLKRLKEAGVLAGLKSSNITIVDPGRAPAKPTKPNIPLYLAVAIVGGLFLGCSSALVVDLFDNKIRGIADLEDLLGQSVMGALPQLVGDPLTAPTGGASPLIAVREPQSTYTEIIRSIRTSLLLARGGEPPKVIQVTSSIAGEGKTLFTPNLAAVLAQPGKRVLLIDTDLRRSALRTRLNLPQGPGLSALLAGQVKEAPIQQVPGVPNLYVLLAGVPPPNPAELLGSDVMRRSLEEWRKQFDFVVLDGPPVLPVTDAVILNYMVDLTLLLVRSRVAQRPQVERSYRTLSEGHDHYIGIVLNGLSAADTGYYNYYGYYGYRSKVYGESDEKKK